jgi:hypothetical protein
VTLTALGEMFEAARSIMNWLGDCAKVSYVVSCLCSEYQAMFYCIYVVHYHFLAASYLVLVLLFLFGNHGFIIE